MKENKELDFYKREYKHWHTVACVALSLLGVLFGSTVAAVVILLNL